MDIMTLCKSWPKRRKFTSWRDYAQQYYGITEIEFIREVKYPGTEWKKWPRLLVGINLKQDLHIHG